MGKKQPKPEQLWVPGVSPPPRRLYPWQTLAEFLGESESARGFRAVTYKLACGHQWQTLMVRPTPKRVRCKSCEPELVQHGEQPKRTRFKFDASRRFGFKLAGKDTGRRFELVRNVARAAWVAVVVENNLDPRDPRSPKDAAEMWRKRRRLALDAARAVYEVPRSGAWINLACEFTDLRGELSHEEILALVLAECWPPAPKAKARKEAA
jgi:hypothetical protein